MIVSDIDGVRMYENTGLHFDQTDLIDISKVKRYLLQKTIRFKHQQKIILKLTYSFWSKTV